MIIDKPTSTEPLRQLWKQAFGDTDAFIDSFFRVGYSQNHCRQITENGKVVSALYWFDSKFDNKKIAYLYGIATHKEYRNRGLCRLLLEDTHRHLKDLGYEGTLLVPSNSQLFSFYEKFGYRTCSSVNEFTAKADMSVLLNPMMADPILSQEDIAYNNTCFIRPLTSRSYVEKRQDYMPAGSVEPDETLMAFANENYSFYTGNDFVMCASAEGATLFVPEFLGNIAAAPGIVAALGKKKGRFRTFGEKKPFAMYRPLTHHIEKPTFFALALD